MRTLKKSAYERAKANQAHWGRPFDLQSDGDWLAKYFNLAATEPGMRDRIEPSEEIVQKLAAMTDEVSRKWAAVEPGANFSVSAHEESEEKRRQFQALIEPHTWHLYLVGWRRKGDKAVPVFCDRPTLGNDADLMFRLIQLARAGILDRLRKCAWCGIWFFARKSWAECHDEACRKAKYRAKPEYKEINRRNVGKHYREVESPHQDKYKKGWSVAEVREWIKKRRRRPKENGHGKKR